MCSTSGETPEYWKEHRINGILVVVGKHVITVEGIGNVDNPHPLQERLAKLHGSQ
jgi:xanthine dehydrogenase iron-sulfur cluster and FAD-binding subunit A